MSQKVLALSSVHACKTFPRLERGWIEDVRSSRPLPLRQKRSLSNRDGTPNGTGPKCDPGLQRQLSKRVKQKQADKEFFADLISSAATKRDAKTYLSRLKSPVSTSKKPKDVQPFSKPAVNIGDLFGRARAVEESPIFTQYDEPKEPTEELETLHVALVKLTAPERYTDDIIEGIARTLSQLSRLSMSPCVVLDIKDTLHWREEYIKQAHRLMSAIDTVEGPIPRRLDNILSFEAGESPEVSFRKLLLRPLRNGQIPIIMPIAYSATTQKAESISADQTILALTREFAGLNLRPLHDSGPTKIAEIVKLLQQQISLDRIILVDEHGGIPRIDSPNQKQVFINLEQEYSIIQDELKGLTGLSSRIQHQSDMELLQTALTYLPPSSSGLVTTPPEAANIVVEDDNQVSSVRTRRQKNTLIHNLLTDKPAYSSSLPSGRLSTTTQNSPTSSTTFIKKGMPLTILPDPRIRMWTSNNQGEPRLKLTDPRIDLSRLVHLIDDSFNRKLDVKDYLDRVNDRIAGVIIAGEYEGGALLTWETPPDVSDDNTSRLVPYLDKFAVLKRSQGAGGVADILFNAMVRTCFPDGVCWRSRKDNPVNKWYFERSRGTWKLPDTNWTMFWTTSGVVENDQTFMDYEGVCRGVQPSWADKKHIMD